MKKKFVLLLCSLMVFSLAGCSSQKEPSDTTAESASEPADASSTPIATPELTPEGKEDKNGYDETTNTAEGFWIYDLSIPSYWTESDSSSFSTKTYVTGEDGIVVAMMQFQCNDTGSMGRDELESDFNDLLDSMSTSLDDYSFMDSSTVLLSGEDAYCADFYCTMNDMKMESRMVASKHEGSSNLYTFFILQAEDSQYDYFRDFEKMIANATFNSDISSSDESSATTTEPTPTPTAEPTPEIPVEYLNALSKARDYLDFTAFSYTGLIDQLEYEGYSAEACTYATDNCGADWNEQALQKAQSYLDYSAFSYAGLIDQLEYEGFTAEQATYAVDGCGADWNEQAAKKAQEYLDYTSFSRQGLIDQLIYEGFTSEQSEYGAAAVGY